MPKKLALFVSVLLLAAIALRADDIGDEIIARVDDQIITRSDMEKAKSTQLEELKQRYPSDWQSHVAKAQADTLRDLIDQQLLLERGKELGITGETELVKRLNTLRQQMGLASIDDLEKEAQKQGVSYEDFKEQIRIGAVTQQVIGQEVGAKIHISNEDIQEWYDKHQKELEGQEEVGLSEIMVSTQPAKANVGEKDKQATQDQPLPEDPAKIAEAEAKANQLLQQLRKGAKFEDLAKQYSEGSTAAQGGGLGNFKRGELAKDLEEKTFSLKPGETTDVIRTRQGFIILKVTGHRAEIGGLGNFKRGELAKDLEEKTFSLKPGETTDVIRTRQGFIILKVTGHRAAGIPPVKDISDRIREQIYSERLEPAARAYLTKLREAAYIDIKPGYAGTGASPNQTNKPVIVAANDHNPVAGKPANKKKKFLVFYPAPTCFCSGSVIHPMDPKAWIAILANFIVIAGLISYGFRLFGEYHATGRWAKNITYLLAGIGMLALAASMLLTPRNALVILQVAQTGAAKVFLVIRSLLLMAAIAAFGIINYWRPLRLWHERRIERDLRRELPKIP